MFLFIFVAISCQGIALSNASLVHQDGPKVLLFCVRVNSFFTILGEVAQQKCCDHSVPQLFKYLLWVRTLCKMYVAPYKKSQQNGDIEKREKEASAAAV